MGIVLNKNEGMLLYLYILNYTFQHKYDSQYLKGILFMG